MLENPGFFLTVYLQQDDRKTEKQPLFVMTLTFEKKKKKLFLYMFTTMFSGGVRDSGPPVC